jgi:hypothetical protein
VRTRARAVTAAAIAFALAAGARAAVPVVPTLPPSALHPGQRAVVRTVFAGDSIESFDAEVMGILPGGRAAGDIILARATSPRVVQSGIAAGMSGSPVYVDGKLIGALALGWPLSKEPIFGVTPIAEMLGVLDQPDSARPDGTSGPAGVDPGTPSARWRGLQWEDAAPDDSLPPVRTPDPARLATLPLPIAASGLSPAAFDLARGLFAGSGFLLTPGGRRVADSGSAADLVPGAAVAVDVLRGDLNFSAIGTVTYRDGDRVLIFGHPFFQSGEVRMPLSTAHIVGILPSLLESSKLGVPGRPVGVATQDRRPAVAGRLGGSPKLMPFAVEVRDGAGAPSRFRFETIEDRTLMPQLVATAAASSFMESGGTNLQQTVRWSLEVWRHGRVLEMADIAAGDAAIGDAVNGIAGPLRFLAGNTYERWVPDSLRVVLATAPGRELWTLRDAAIANANVRPGGRLHVTAGLERWRGERRELSLDVDVPEELPEGKYTLWLGGGQELDRVTTTRLPSRFRPTSVDDALRRLAALHASDALYTVLWVRAPDVTRDGLDYPELPTSAVPLLAPSQAAGERTRRSEWAAMDEHAHALTGVLRGEISLEFHVDEKAP